MKHKLKRIFSLSQLTLGNQLLRIDINIHLTLLTGASRIVVCVCVETPISAKRQPGQALQRFLSLHPIQPPSAKHSLLHEQVATNYIIAKFSRGNSPVFMTTIHKAACMPSKLREFQKLTICVLFEIY